MKRPNWTEPRVYTDPDNRPYAVTIYDMDDGLREVASVRVSRHDGPEHIARVKAEFALMSAAPGLLAQLRAAKFQHESTARLLDKAGLAVAAQTCRGWASEIAGAISKAGL